MFEKLELFDICWSDL